MYRTVLHRKPHQTIPKTEVKLVHAKCDPKNIRSYACKHCEQSFTWSEKGRTICVLCAIHDMHDVRATCSGRLRASTQHGVESECSSWMPRNTASAASFDAQRTWMYPIRSPLHPWNKKSLVIKHSQCNTSETTTCAWTNKHSLKS